MKKLIVTERESVNAILVGLITQEETEEQVTEYLDELAFLANTANINTVHRVTQRLTMANSVTFVGSGKLQEIKEYIEAEEEKDNKIGVVIFDDELSPRQIRNIERVLEVPILDRTSLILDIFAMRAQT
ncbi:MAG: GTPase HflX, partial [Bacteroidales bacterium]|nr:GTPase HflX [Bacteroidales bacterium]